MFGENGLGMKLYAFNIELMMTQPHDSFLASAIVLGPGSDLEAVWQRARFNHKAVISGGGEWAGQIFEHPSPV